MDDFKKIPKKYHPRGYEILYEDRDLLVGNKAQGFLSVRANFEKVQTIHHALNQYVRKGNSKSRKCVFVVHRLDQDTTGVMIFAKTPHVQMALKDNWKEVTKIYFCMVHGRIAKRTDTISSYLEEDEDYVMHSSATNKKGKLAHTQYEVLEQTDKFSLVKINLLTGRKNQIRVHMADIGHPVVGDDKYGHRQARHKDLFLHARSISFKHPINGKEIYVQAPVPDYFKKLINYSFE